MSVELIASWVRLLGGLMILPRTNVYLEMEQ